MICPRCGREGFGMGSSAGNILGLGGRLFCPECGYTESISESQKREDKKIKKREKQKLISEFDEILKQINDNNVLMMLNEWRPKLLILLESVK